ncbi:hypothetical protein DFA_04656 [Cavenderia fasciculata]|uniref:Carbohydrate binding domain-containing protein n=1 Tax=Cavenderia fasciculata TaxID=261658 RepID=F4PQ65_CACFS|nr:uncharacterized protein DFA_04656 [Cavenderia fasciculata]EGG22528.1 hypothetical protein DFA_04656 [Cavenderia fasciculata]|eukprot:XP_004360379.1 hypothetical protein DFA_04656 [Cavenderia fasciculata]
MKIIIIILIICLNYYSFSAPINQSCNNLFNQFLQSNDCIVASVSGVHKYSLAQEGLKGFLQVTSDGKLNQTAPFTRLQTYETTCYKNKLQPFSVHDAFYTKSFVIDIANSSIQIDGVTNSLFCDDQGFAHFIQNDFYYSLIVRGTGSKNCPSLQFGEPCGIPDNGFKITTKVELEEQWNYPQDQSKIEYKYKVTVTNSETYAVSNVILGFVGGWTPVQIWSVNVQGDTVSFPDWLSSLAPGASHVFGFTSLATNPTFKVVGSVRQYNSFPVLSYREEYSEVTKFY